MKQFTLFLLIIILGGLAFSQSIREKKMPITTDSETARTLYLKGWDAFDDFRFDQGRKLFLEAVNEDTDFFLANYTLALININNDADKFKEYVESAIRSRANLSEGELLLKDAISKLLTNTESDLTEIGKELVELYPSDVFAYKQLAYFQRRINDLEGQIKTFKSVIEIVDDPANYFNSLGYAYMRDGRYEGAEIAFDKYIELAPDHPNPYDSKGEYFETTKDYLSASESYMKAYKLDSTSKWRLDKAIKAELEVFRIGHKEAVDSKDIENILQFYSKDMITLPNGEPIIYGNEWIKTLLEEFYASYDFHEDFNYTDIRVYSKNWVATSYNFKQTMTSLTNEESDEESGQGKCILKRAENGNWQFEWNAYTLN